MKIIRQLFFELFHRFPLHFFSLFGLVLFQAFFGALGVVAIAPITDNLLGRTGSDASQITIFLSDWLAGWGINLGLLEVFIFFAGVNLVNGLIAILTRFAVLRIKYDVLIHLLVGMLREIFNARYGFFSENRIGLLLNSFQTEVQKVGDAFGHIAAVFANSIQLLVFLIVPLTLSFKLTFVFLISLIVIGGPLVLIRKLTYRLGAASTSTGNKLMTTLHQILTGAKLVLSFGKQKETISIYRQALVEHSAAAVRFHTFHTGIRELFMPIGAASALIALYVAHEDGVPLSEMAVVLFAFMKMIPVLGLTIQGKTYVEGFVPAYEQLLGIRREATAWKESEGREAFPGLKKEIELSNVYFSYPGRTETLKGISLKIKRNEMVALVGRSGVGKSTIADLILGLYQPDRGVVNFDGRNLENYSVSSVRHRIGYVAQDSFFFDGSIRDNLTWSTEDASQSQIELACERANAQEFIDLLPSKLDTLIGDRGTRLSGGQRQRLALARALLRQPDLLILDEATSALDSESERAIQAAIDDLTAEMAVLVVAHRLSTVRKANRIYVISAGRVVEEGNFDNLSERETGYFAKMMGDRGVF